MKSKVFEEIKDVFYAFGHVSYQIGRIETDGVDAHQKKYEKLCKEKEELNNRFKELLKECRSGDKE